MKKRKRTVLSQKKGLLPGIANMKKVFLIFLCAWFLMLCTACTMMSDERVKLKDLDFTVLSEEVLPQELKQLIEEKKSDAFKFTYSDRDFLYICIGYGEKETGGYSIAVNDLYLTETAIYVETELLGPGPEDKNHKTPSYPYIVIKTEYLDQTVIFE